MHTPQFRNSGVKQQKCSQVSSVTIAAVQTGIPTNSRWKKLRKDRKSPVSLVAARAGKTYLQARLAAPAALYKPNFVLSYSVPVRATDGGLMLVFVPVEVAIAPSVAGTISTAQLGLSLSGHIIEQVTTCLMAASRGETMRVRLKFLFDSVFRWRQFQGLRSTSSSKFDGRKSAEAVLARHCHEVDDAVDGVAVG